MTLTVTPGDAACTLLQFGHDSSPWMTFDAAAELNGITALQFGHDSSPWMTRP